MKSNNPICYIDIKSSNADLISSVYYTVFEHLISHLVGQVGHDCVIGEQYIASLVLDKPVDASQCVYILVIIVNYTLPYCSGATLQYGEGSISICAVGYSI